MGWDRAKERVVAPYSEYEVNPSSGVTGYNTISGSSTVTETFSKTVRTIDIYTKDNDIYVEISKDGSTFGSKIMLRGSINQVVSLEVECKAVRFSNVVTDGTADGSYQVVGWR